MIQRECPLKSSLQKSPKKYKKILPHTTGASEANKYDVKLYKWGVGGSVLSCATLVCGKAVGSSAKKVEQKLQHGRRRRCKKGRSHSTTRPR